jgi:hypothetical protein
MTAPTVMAAVVPAAVKQALQVSTVRVPIMPAAVARKDATDGHDAYVSDFLRKSTTFAVRLNAPYTDLSACFQNGDTLHRWVLMRAEKICLPSALDEEPYLFVQGVSTTPIAGSFSARLVGEAPKKTDMDGIIRLTVVGDKNKADVRSFCAEHCLTAEEVETHERDPVATFIVQLKEGATLGPISQVACATAEENVLRRTSLKGLTVKFGARSTQEAFDAIAPRVASWQCWLRQHSMRVFVPAKTVDEVKAHYEGLGFRVRTDDKPRRDQHKVWSAAVATAPPEATVVVDDHFLLCSVAPMTVKTITTVCRQIGAVPLLDGFVCLRAIKIVFEDGSVLANALAGTDYVTPDALTKQYGVVVALESQRAQKF